MQGYCLPHFLFLLLMSLFSSLIILCGTCGTAWDSCPTEKYTYLRRFLYAVGLWDKFAHFSIYKTHIYVLTLFVY